MMPPSPETSKRWYSMYCRECGTEEMMADAAGDARLVARRDEHNRRHVLREDSEPSDAQVQAAMSAARAVYIANGWVLSAPHAEEEDAMRAALRAVWGHGENNRGEAAAVSSALWASLKGHVPTDEQMGNAYLAAGYRRVAEVGQAVHDG